MEVWRARSHKYLTSSLKLYASSPLATTLLRLRSPIAARSSLQPRYRTKSTAAAPPMTTTIELASVPTADTPGTTIFVHNEKHSYIFGRPSEGTQRAHNSRRIGMSNIEHMFLSGSVCWDQIGGVFGYSLTLGGVFESSREVLATTNAEREKKGQKLHKPSHSGIIGIHGGENLNHALASMRPVILRQPVRAQTFEYRDDARAEKPDSLEPDWQDDALKVWKVPVRRARSSSPQKRRLTEETEGEDGSAEPTFKANDGPSDPELAKFIVENIMFDGDLKGDGTLIPKQLRHVTPSDATLIKKDGELLVYRGPFAGDGVEIPNADETVWVVPRKHDVLDKNTQQRISLSQHPLERTKYSEVGLSYIVKCQTRRGKFNVNKAKELGVKPPDFKLLASGESVTGADGVVVTPDMVLGEAQPGKGFVIADIESLEFLDSFLERPEWSNPELMAEVVAFYWILGPGMATNARIQEFVQSHPSMQHVFCASDTCPNMIALGGAGRLQVRLHRLDPDRFSLLKYNNSVQGPIPSGPQIELGRAGSRITLMPRLTVDNDSQAPFPDLLEAAKSVGDEFLEMSQAAKEQTSQEEFLRQAAELETDIPNRDAEIIPLGTGSSMPSKYRNVSATLVRVPGIGSYLLDCGEGTFGQIRRLFGDEETRDILRDLKCIVVSHIHADHHIGVPSVIKAWYEATLSDTNAKLAISCIARYRKFLEEVAQIEDIGFHRLRFVSCSTTQDIGHTTSTDLGEENFGLASVKRIPVPHCWRSYATQLELTSGLRVAYSGDCRPSDNFARECEGAHLLVHECTFDDDMMSHAKKKKHSTMGEALGVARKMRARRTLLTHFSQRYVKADSLKGGEAAEGEDRGETLMAFDLMRVRLGDFKAAAAFQPAIANMLTDVEK